MASHVSRVQDGTQQLIKKKMGLNKEEAYPFLTIYKELRATVVLEWIIFIFYNWVSVKRAWNLNLGECVIPVW